MVFCLCYVPITLFDRTKQQWNICISFNNIVNILDFELQLTQKDEILGLFIIYAFSDEYKVNLQTIFQPYIQISNIKKF